MLPLEAVRQRIKSVACDHLDFPKLLSRLQCREDILLVMFFDADAELAAEARQRNGLLACAEDVLRCRQGVGRNPDDREAFVGGKATCSSWFAIQTSMCDASHVHQRRGRRPDETVESSGLVRGRLAAFGSAVLAIPNVQQKPLNRFINRSVEAAAGLVT